MKNCARRLLAALLTLVLLLSGLPLAFADEVEAAEAVEVTVPAEEPAVEEPAVEEPVVEEPVVEEPAVEEPAVEEPVVEEPAVEEPVVEEPAVEEPAVDEPAVEEPVVEEPAVEEPAVEEPAVEEPEFQIIEGILVAYNGDEEEVIIPEEVTEIGERAFAENEFIVKVILPDTITKIHNEAFCSCPLLEEITIPESVEEIGENAFSGCPELVVTVHENTVAYDYCTANAQAQNFACEIIYEADAVTLSRPVMGPHTVLSSLQLKLTWEKVEGAQGYELWRSDAADGTYVKVADTTALQKVDDCIFGKINYYKVRAYADDNGTRVYSQFSVYRSSFGLATAGIKTLEARADGVLITANTVANGTGYYIYRCDTVNGTYDRLGTTTLSGGTNTFLDTTAEHGKTYYYKCRVYHISYVNVESGVQYNGPFSAAKSVTAGVSSLSRPVMGAHTVLSSLQLKLTWEKVDGADGYELWRSDAANGTYTKVADTTALEKVDDCIFGKINYYKVRAYETTASGGRLYSQFSVYRSSFGLATAGVQKMEIREDGVLITAGTVANGTGYYIYRCETINGTYDRLGTTTLAADGTNTFLDTTAVPGKTYYYKCRVFHISYVNVETGVQYNGPFSVAKKCVLPGPNWTSLEQTAVGAVTATWQAVEGAAGYYIYGSDSQNGTYTHKGTVTGGDVTTITLTGLTEKATYYYKLRAYYLDANGDKKLFPNWSEIRSVYVDEAAVFLFDFEATADGSGIIIKGYNGNEAYVVVPETLRGAPIVEIAAGAFEGNTTLTGIDLPDTVRVIGERAFAGCTNLREMN